MWEAMSIKLRKKIHLFDNVANLKIFAEILTGYSIQFSDQCLQ